MKNEDRLEKQRTVCIIGVGLIGGSLGLALKRKTRNITLIGIDDDAVIEEAISLGAIDQGLSKQHLEKGLIQADIVFLCTPISQILSLLPTISQSVKPGTLVTDVGSTKSHIVKTAEPLFSNGSYFIGGHPMTGSEYRGVRWADGLLFENTVYVLTPSQQLPVSLTQDFGDLIETLGAKVVFISPTMHDRVAAAVSHLPQLCAVSLMNLVAKQQKDSPLFLKLASGGFRDMTRIASSPYYIWNDILDTNREEIAQFLEVFVEELGMTRKRLIDGQLEDYFQDAGRHRLSIPRDTRGFLRPNYDLSIRVEDKPGEIADIATALSEEKINIKDIEVLKVREGDAGTIRISLETQEERLNAQKILNKIGYTSRLRN